MDYYETCRESGVVRNIRHESRALSFTSERVDRRSAVVLAWQTLLVLLFAVWWGGLTFYASVVVPIGTHQIGSIEQGFITQQVTRWHNCLLTAMTVCLLCEAWRSKRRSLWIVSGILAVIDLLLIGTHFQLSAMLDFDNRLVPSGFYQTHAIYLWLTSAEWVLGLSLPLLACRFHSSDS